MKNNIWAKRIPKFIFIIFIILSIAITSILVKNGVLFITKASPSQIPEDIRITNISDNSFTVSYATEENVTGSINFGKDINFGQVGLDERDQKTGSLTPHKIHHITVKNITPKTSYFFEIISGEDHYSNNKNPFKVTTGALIESNPPAQEPLIGNILLPNGSKPTEVMVYLTLKDSQDISTLAKDDGSFILPLNSLRRSDLSSYLNLDKNNVINLFLIGDSLKSNVKLSLRQSSPIPLITLSQNYDFIVSNNPIASESGVLESFPTVSVKQSKSNTKDPQIITPKKDQSFSDPTPQFKGTALPNEKVQIEIHSQDNIKAQVTTDSTGNWTYRPSTTLSPGQHTVTITTKDSFGILKTITQSFVVHAAEITATPTPTIFIPPSVIPTTLPVTKLPATGNSSILLTSILATFITFVGGLLFFLTKKSSV